MSDLPLEDVLQKKIQSAVDVLADGGVAAIPTDTLYGLAACAFDESAVMKVYELKGRPEGMALPLLLSEAGDALRCVVEVPESLDTCRAFLAGRADANPAKERGCAGHSYGGQGYCGSESAEPPGSEGNSEGAGRAYHGNERESEREARADDFRRCAARVRGMP